MERYDMLNAIQLEEFDTWWSEVAQSRMDYFIDNYLNTNPEYTEEDVEDYTDSGCVHRLVHEGETGNVLWQICQEVFEKGHNDENWEMSMSDSLFCELDDIIQLSYEAGQRYAAEEKG